MVQSTTDFKSSNSNDNKTNLDAKLEEDGHVSGTTTETETKKGDDTLEIEYATGTRLVLLTLAVSLAFFVVFLDSTIVSTVIPKITSVFDSLDDVGWYGSSYLIVMAALQPSFGKIYTVYDVKTVYLISLVIFGAGSVICAAATSSLMFILGRAVAGLGASALVSGAFIITTYTVPLEKQAAYNAGVSTTFAIASITGPPIGGAFTDKVSWRWAFWINLPIVGVTALIMVVFFKSPRKNLKLPFKEKMSNLDFFGAVLFVGAVVCLLLALQWGGIKYPWSNPKVWGLFLGFALILPVFIFVQIKRGKRATMPITIVKQRTVIVSILYLFLYSMAYYVHVFYLPLYFQAIKHTSAVTSGLRLIPYLIANTITAVTLGIYVNRTGHHYYPLWIGAIVYTVGSGLLSTLGVGSSTAQWLCYQIIAGIGRGSGQLPYVSAQVALDPKDIPIGASLLMLSSSLGGAVALAVSQTIFDSALTSQLVKDVPSIAPSIILNTGATDFQNVVPADQLDGVLKAYAKAVQTVMITPIAFAGASFLLSLGIERVNVKSKKRS